MFRASWALVWDQRRRQETRKALLHCSTTQEPVQVLEKRKGHYQREGNLSFRRVQTSKRSPFLYEQVTTIDIHTRHDIGLRRNGSCKLPFNESAGRAMDRVDKLETGAWSVIQLSKVALLTPGLTLQHCDHDNCTGLQWGFHFAAQHLYHKYSHSPIFATTCLRQMSSLRTFQLFVIQQSCSGPFVD